MRTPTTSRINVRLPQLPIISSNAHILRLATFSSMVPVEDMAVVPARELTIRGEPMCQIILRLTLAIRSPTTSRANVRLLQLATLSSNDLLLPLQTILAIRIPATSGRRLIIRLPTTSSDNHPLRLLTLSSRVPVVPAEELPTRGEPLCQ
jgi:hypothetical protein